MPYYVVQQGDQLSGIAKQFGFPDYTKVWNHPGNADLKAARKNPHVLYPGDRVFIPELRLGEHSAPTDKKHKYVLKAKPLHLQVKLEKMYYKPIGNKACDLSFGLERFELHTDSSGSIQHAVRKDATSARLVVHDSVTIEDKPAPLDVLLPVKIGYLDPVEEVSGQAARLSNLAYYRGPLERPDREDFRCAVEEFQCENHLHVDGLCGRKTQARLKEVHGC